MSSYQTIQRINEIKSSIAVYMNAAKNHMTQKEILQLRNEWLQCSVMNLPKKEQTRILKASLLAFSEGYFQAITENATVFLYNVDGKFYKTNHCDLNFPCWDQLPREQWDKLGEKGGIYWRETLKPFS